MQNTTRTDEIIRTLEEEILGGVLRPGARLDEAELAKRFAVSRTPIRDALRHLAAAALVDFRPRQSAIVARLTIPRMIEMFEVMGELEGACARLACGRITGEQLAAARAANADCATTIETGDVQAFYAANNRFHEAIYLAAGNEFLREQTLALRNRLSPYRRQVTYQPGRMRATVMEHERVLAAITRMDPPAADLAMRSHVQLLGSGVSDLISALGADGEDAAGADLGIERFASSLG
jgi:DNA-binding GntR family transcriptional regulator